MSGRQKLSAEAKRSQRAAARLYAVQALFQMESSGQTIEAIEREFEDFRIGAETETETWAEADINHFRRLVETAVDRQAEIDQMTDRALVVKWPIARIDPTLRAMFRAAGAEMLGAATPVRVILHEFVEITKAFFPEGREAKFVNAVLDHMAHEARAADF